MTPGQSARDSQSAEDTYSPDLMERLRHAFASVARGDSDARLPAKPLAALLHETRELVALAMRDEGMNQPRAVAAVRARVRLVLDDGGLTGQIAGVLVARASQWVDEIYRAA